MYIKWNEKTVRWFKDASAYTGFNEKFAELLLPYIVSRNTLADLGCGMGLIDLELSRHIDQISCVDIDDMAVSTVRELISEREIKNITALTADATALSQKWDTVLAMFHGRVETFVTKYLEMANEVMITVVRGSPNIDPDSPEHIIRNFRTVEQTSQILDSFGIKYELYLDSLEYGQPLRSLDDAFDYTNTYSKCRHGEDAAAYLKRRLIETGNGKFPFYLPLKKNFGIYVIRKAENMPLCGL